MALQSIEYWKKRRDTFKEFGIRMKHVEDMLRNYPEDYTALREELIKAIKQNYLNMQYCHQEIETLQLCH